MLAPRVRWTLDAGRLRARATKGQPSRLSPREALEQQFPNRGDAALDWDRRFTQSHCGTALVPKSSRHLKARGLRGSPGTGGHDWIGFGSVLVTRVVAIER